MYLERIEEMNKGYHMGRSASKGLTWYHDHGAECCGIGPFENNHFPLERAVASKISVILDICYLVVYIIW